MRAPRKRQQILHFLDPIEVSPIFVELTISMTRLSRPTRERFFNSNPTSPTFFCGRCTIFYPRFYIFLLLFSPLLPRYIYRSGDRARSIEPDNNSRLYIHKICKICSPDNVSLLYLSVENKIKREESWRPGSIRYFPIRRSRYIYIYKCKHYHSCLTTNHVFLLI